MKVHRMSRRTRKQRREAKRWGNVAGILRTTWRALQKNHTRNK